MDPQSAGGRLRGIRVALAETRELDRLASILEAEGAEALRCPLVTILDAPDPTPVDAWLRRLTEQGFQDLIFLTGEGLRRLLARARVLDPARPRRWRRSAAPVPSPAARSRPGRCTRSA